MIKMNGKTPERDEIEALLPWHAAGTLGRREAERVERALGLDAELARHYALVREELAETIHLNETLGAPSGRVMEKLFTAIEAEAPPARSRAFDFSGWLAGLMQQFSPRALAWSGTAAAIAILIQAGLLVGIYMNEQSGGGGKFETASYDPAPRGGDIGPQGAYALVRFNPQASVADITRFFAANQASLVEGPRGGGLYRIRLSSTTVSPEELASMVAKLGEDKNVIAFIVPTQ